MSGCLGEWVSESVSGYGWVGEWVRYACTQ